MDDTSLIRQYAAIDEIKTLKYRYIRYMTLSLWNELEQLLTQEVQTSYSDGAYVFENRDDLMRFLRSSNDKSESKALGYWQVGMPEIELTSEHTATGIWGMYHFYLDKVQDQQLEMFCYYADEYVKTDGRWKIAKTGYRRVFEQNLDRKRVGGFTLSVG